MSSTHFKLGTQYSNQDLHSMILLQPTLLWSLPTFRTRIGVHFLGEYGGPFGAVPISGIGMSGYFYPMGISTAYEFTGDGVLLQKSITGPFVFAGLTPVNFNVNKSRLGDGSGQSDLSVFSLMYEFAIGVGVDYSFHSNMVLFGELGYRQATAQENTAKGSVSYQSPIFILGFSTAYY